MKRRLISIGVAAMMAIVVSVPSLAATAANGNQCDGRNGDFQGKDLFVVGLTSDQRLICFEEDAPAAARSFGTISGLAVDVRIVGIDYRPTNGRLYALGDAGGVYTLNRRTAAATLRSRLDVPLDGNRFDIDFNPTVDRLRIISDTGQNLRANVDDGVTLTDGVLNHVGPPPVSPATGVTGAAYTNNDSDANTATTLYAIDALNDQLVTQVPPNAGSLNVVGKLRVNTTAEVGFDIYSTIRNGTTIAVDGLASLRVGENSRLYSVRLFSGQVLFQGNFKPGHRVIDIAVPLNQI